MRLPHQRASASLASCLLALLCCDLGLAQAQPAEEPMRLWRSKAGTQVIASIHSQDADSVTLKIPDRGQPVRVALDMLEDEDRRFARLLWVSDQDLKQFSYVKEHLRTVIERPKTVARLLIEVHNQFPESPYAGLWAAVTLSHGSNEHSRARVLLEQVIGRIDAQRELDANRHRMTLTSACSNLAVCLVKERRGDSAANWMAQAIEVSDKLPPVIRSNAELLNELTVNETAAITFSPRSRQRLMRAVALAETPGSGTKLTPGWHYSLDFNTPTKLSGSLKTEGLDAPRADLELLASGTGFVVAPGIVLTARPVVETTNYNGPKLVTIVTDPTKATRKSELVSHLLVAATRSVAESSTRLSNELIGDVVWTNYSYARPVNGQLGAEVAALRVPNLMIAPVEVAAGDPTGGAVIILGYERGPDALSKGIQTESGILLDPRRVANVRSALGSTGASRAMETSARVLGGNRGGPVINENGKVVGIAFDTPISGSAANGLIFGAGEFRRWFYDNVQNASITDVVEATEAKSRASNVRTATVPVFCWGLRQRTESQLFSQFADISRDSGGLYIRDGWCIACDGKGFVDCPVKGCNKGIVAGRKVVPVGTNPLTGQPQTARKVTKEKCSVCNGKGGQICPHCDQGRI